MEIPFQSELRIDDIHHAIARWMEANLEHIVFTREVEADITDWDNPRFMRELCNCGVFERRHHTLIPVGAIPGVIAPAGGVMDMILYQHGPARSDEPWTLRFAWVENQLTRGGRNSAEDALNAWSAFTCMLAQLELSDY